MSGLGIWYAFTPVTWARVEMVAAARDERSATAANTRTWNPRHNLIGVAGEAVYSQHCGLPWNESPDLADGGFDFPGVDVKATPRWQAPRLLRLASDPLKAPLYALVALNLEYRRGRVVGYATREMVAAAPLEEYGFGPTRTLRECDLLGDLAVEVKRPCQRCGRECGIADKVDGGYMHSECQRGGRTVWWA